MLCLGINAVPLYQIKLQYQIENLRIELKTNAGTDSKMWDWFNLKLGAWGA